VCALLQQQTICRVRCISLQPGALLCQLSVAAKMHGSIAAINAGHNQHMQVALN
jgi:hypothetical protein